MPLKKILLTGKQPSQATQIDRATAQSLILDGRGWSNTDRYTAYDQLDPDTLLEKLGSWSPTVRERATIALMRRKGDKPVAALLEMLDSPSLYARYGACDMFTQLRGAAAPAVPKLTALLSHDDLWLRIKAADALANIGAPAMPSLPILLEKLAQPPTAKDPRGMEQRYLCFSVFDVMLKQPLDGVDRALLRKAITAGLQNQDGRARGSISVAYQRLSFEDLQPIMPAILEAVATPSPSGEMFADGIRVAGLELLAKHHVEEGMTACLAYIVNQNKWASQIRTGQLLNIFRTYGTHCQQHIPELERIAASFEAGENDFPLNLSKQKAADVRAAIAAIREAKETPSLRKISS